MPVYSKDDILRYYEALGVIDREGLFYPKEGKTVKLDSLSELFDINELGECGDWLEDPDTYIDSQVVGSMRNLSDAYSMLHFCIFNGFMYESKAHKQKAFDAAMAVYDDLKDINVEVKGDDVKSALRRNNLRTTILRGLCCAGDLVRFRLQQDNNNFETIYSKITDIEKEDAHCEKNNFGCDKTPDALMKLYYLAAYAKFAENGSGFEMFDFGDNVSLGKLRSLVRRNRSEGVALKGEDKTPLKPGGRVLRMSHYRLNKSSLMKNETDDDLKS